MTLVELLVMSMAALMLVGVIWFLFFGGMRHFRKTDDKLKGVQGAQLLMEQLQDDFDRICWSEDFPLEGAGQNGADTNKITFYVYDRTVIPGKLKPRSRVEQVSYRFDQDSRRMYRNEEAMRFARFETVSFKFQPASKKPIGAGSGTGTGAAGGSGADPAKEELNTLVYTISAASEEKLDRMDSPSATKEEGEDRRGITTLLGTVHLPGKVLSDHFPGWIENPPDKPAEK